MCTCVGEDTGKTEEFEAKKRKIEEVISLEEPPSVEPPEVCVWCVAGPPTLEPGYTPVVCGSNVYPPTLS